MVHRFASDVRSPALSASLFVAAVLVAGGWGCHWTRAPDSKTDALTAPIQVSSTPADDDHDLFATRRGDWALLDDRSDKRFEAGDLALLRRSERARHLFAVTARHEWGLRLQRLDRRRLGNDPDRGRMQRVGGLDSGGPIAELACAGRGPLVESACWKRAPARTAWDVYALDARGRPARTEGPFASTAPYGRAAVVWKSRGSEPRILPEDAELGDRWLAVRASGARPPSTAVAAVDPECSFPVDALETRGIRTVEGPHELPDHPVAVESIAYELGADVAVACTQRRIAVATPTLLRPYPHLRGDVPTGPPLVGARPTRLPSRETSATAAAVAALAHLAAGDTAAADFLLERTFRRLGPAELGDLMVDAMQIAAASDRPEAALHWGRAASSKRWNRDNQPRYLLGVAAVHHAAGSVGEYFAGMQRARQAAARRSKTGFARWLAWSSAAANRENAGSLEQAAREHLQSGRPRWAAGYSWIRARSHPSFRPDVLSESTADRHGFLALFDGLRREKVHLPCANADECPLDVYGRRLSALLERKGRRATLLTALSRVGGSSFRPGFWATANYRSLPMHRKGLEVAAAMSALAGDVELPNVDARLSELLAHALESDTFCEARFSNPVRSVLDAAADRSDELHARVEFFHWLNGDGRTATCSEPAEAARYLAALSTRSESMAAFVSPLFAHLLGRTRSLQTRREVAEGAAAFAAEQNRGRACKRRRLGLAAQAAESGDVRRSERYLKEAVNCDAAAAYERSEAMLTAYTAYLRSGSLPRGLARKWVAPARRLVRQSAPRDRCPGLADLDFRLFDELDDEIREFARALAEGPRTDGDPTSDPRSSSSKGDPSIELRTSHGILERARSELRQTGRALRRGEPEEAYQLLRNARDAFQRLQHEPGLARTAFLARALFDRSAEDLSASPPAFESCSASNASEESSETTDAESADLPASARQLRCHLQGTTRAEATELARSRTAGAAEDLSASQLRSIAAAALLFDPDLDLQKLVADRPAAFSDTLCRSDYRD